MDAPPRKRRDSLTDQLGAPIYTGDPLPPYPSLVRDLLYVSALCDPAAAAAVLPPGLTPVEPAVLTIAAYEHGPGWGFADATVGFIALAVNEHAAPDTSEAAVFLHAVMSGPAQALALRHIGPFQPGGAEIRHETTPEGELLHARLFSLADGDILRFTLRVTGPPTPQAANDRYIGRTGSGLLVASIVSVTGPARECEVIALDLADTAPAVLRSLGPIRPLFAMQDPELVTCWLRPEPLWPEDAASRAAGRALLLEHLDAQGRAIALVSATGHVIEANRSARVLLAQVPPGCRDPLRPASPAAARRFMADLARLPQRRGRPALPLLLPREGNAGPLLVDLTLADPNPGAVVLLARIVDPQALPLEVNPATLELLGLTPAEARIAAAVGAGLPPREAALRLGLQESTVRSSLKVIFGKLGLTRQAELARLIARLEV